MVSHTRSKTSRLRDCQLTNLGKTPAKHLEMAVEFACDDSGQIQRFPQSNCAQKNGEVYQARRISRVE
jgi:hypothetical protein